MLKNGCCLIKRNRIEDLLRAIDSENMTIETARMVIDFFDNYSSIQSVIYTHGDQEYLDKQSKYGFMAVDTNGKFNINDSRTVAKLFFRDSNEAESQDINNAYNELVDYLHKIRRVHLDALPYHLVDTNPVTYIKQSEYVSLVDNFLINLESYPCVVLSAETFKRTCALIHRDETFLLKTLRILYQKGYVECNERYGELKIPYKVHYKSKFTGDWEQGSLIEFANEGVSLGSLRYDESEMYKHETDGYIYVSPELYTKISSNSSDTGPQ